MQWAKSPADFRQTCGDTYINAIHHGATLYVALQLHFNKKIDKTAFDEKFGVSFYNLIGFSAEIKKSLTTIHSKGNIHVMAYQLGGDPTQLSKLFGSGESPTIDPSPITQCSFDNMKSCNALLGNVLKYITTTYPAQLKLPADGSVPGLAAETGFETEP